MTRPAWLDRHLEAIGLADSDGTTLRPRAARCRRCRAHVIRALDGDVCGLPVECDPKPINELGETTLLIQGIRTYALRRYGDQLRLERRYPDHIAGQAPTAAGRRYDVLAAHRCHQPIPDPLITLPATTRAQIAPHLTEPPF